jgi:hypothetical protein
MLGSLTFVQVAFEVLFAANFTTATHVSVTFSKVILFGFKQLKESPLEGQF